MSSTSYNHYKFGFRWLHRKAKSALNFYGENNKYLHSLVVTGVSFVDITLWKRFENYSFHVWNWQKLICKLNKLIFHSLITYFSAVFAVISQETYKLTFNSASDKTLREELCYHGNNDSKQDRKESVKRFPSVSMVNKFPSTDREYVNTYAHNSIILLQGYHVATLWRFLSESFMPLLGEI